jgi:hypothetical protein
VVIIYMCVYMFIYLYAWLSVCLEASCLWFIAVIQPYSTTIKVRNRASVLKRSVSKMFTSEVPGLNVGTDTDYPE